MRLSSIFKSGRRTVLVSLAALALPALAQQKLPDTMEQRTAACTACHSPQGKVGADAYYPRIAGKPAGYLYNQLVNFREGRRTYPLMTYMVDHLSGPYLMEMAQYFSSLHPPYPPPAVSDAPAAVLARGKVLAMEGDKSKNVPACIACHGQALTGVAPAIPGLIGLPRDYVNAQFGAWKNGTRRTVAPDCMAEITKRLSFDDINAVASWLAAQSAPANPAPAAAALAKLPMECGSVHP